MVIWYSGLFVWWLGGWISAQLDLGFCFPSCPPWGLWVGKQNLLIREYFKDVGRSE